MDKIKRQFTLKNLIEFIKLQLAGNILFWGTYAGFFVFESLLHWSHLSALVTGSAIAHFLFFIVNKEWVFKTDSGQARTTREAMRFVIFMGLNFFINIGIITGLEKYFGITPYIGQFISAFFFTLWTWLGLKFWVFHDARPVSLIAKRRPRAKRKK